MENKSDITSEPTASSQGANLSSSGLLGQLKKLDHADKVALMEYLNGEVGVKPPFMTDESGRIVLNQKIKDALADAERHFNDGNCMSEADFKARFAKWL